ncbi:hypothetical protein [Streptomyces ipomoeae]|uniref:hypothetical protein n=1 Tax=Streptomyces ipomoeae TaxID=103232 RepID=UPI00114685CC|nr:hypothetical protein [Streptomyces ipomoeae]TQE33068.1 hypothetical protein Sipo7851_21430 [Streptomyces ipomoeae]
MSAAVKNEPPAAAVAADAHWTQKMARLRARAAAEVPLYLWQDQTLRERFEEARRTARRARQLADADPDNTELAAEADAAEQALEDVRAAHEADCEVLVFRALPGDAFTKLVKAHPPTEEEAEEGSDWNEETFPAALIAAASVDPMTEEDAAVLLAEWGMADRAALFQAALTAQNARRSDWGKGSGPTRG